MRISGGLARGSTLAVPKGDLVRPATDGMRQAVFSSLAPRLTGARFVDLFAGSGGYGLEAWSRGAAGGGFVEQNPKALACIRQNMTTVARSAGLDLAALRVVAGDAVTWLPSPGDARPDLVFVDPPYPLIGELAPRLFANLLEVTSAADDPLVLFEHPGELELTAPGWALVKRIGRGVRQPTVGIFRRVTAA